MSGSPLLHVATPFLVMDIHGPARPSRGVHNGDSLPEATLEISSSIEPVEAEWLNLNGVAESWSLGEAGPRFFEETTYRIRVKSLISNQVPIPVHRDPHIFKGIDTYAEDRMCAGTVNFQRQVGHSTLEFRVGHESVRITIEIFPVKLDYASDYQLLLSEVSSSARGLALEYLRATFFRSGDIIDAEDSSNIEWLTLLQDQILTLEESVYYINDHPNRQITRQIENLDLHRARRVDSSIRRSVVRGLGYGSQVEITGVGKVHSQIPAVRSRETLNTPEHKWLRLNLFMIAQHLADLHAHVAGELQRHQASRRVVPKRLQVEEEELANFVGRIEELLALPVFNGIEELPPPGFSSLSLLIGLGYGDAYRAIAVLRMGLAIQGDDIDFSVRDIHDLYEAWCFIRLVNLIAAKCVGAVDVSGLVRAEESGIRVRLKRGEKSEIEFKDGSHGRKLILSYNPSFSGLTGDQRPDVVLRIQQESWPELVVVFDAKYRLDASDEYIRRFRSVGPPVDAINAIHRYRDAIVVESMERGLQRPVVKGAALFPLSAEDAGAFEASSLFRALEALGVGALPFLPSNTEMVDRWLSVLLSTEPEQLAEPGPPFAGLAERFRRHTHT